MMKNWMSRGERVAALGVVALCLIAMACASILVVQDQSDGYVVLGYGLLLFNATQLGRVIFLLWEDRHG